MERKGIFTYLTGGAYELGRKQAQELSLIPDIQNVLFNEKGLTNQYVEEGVKQLELFYPSLLLELKGVSDYFDRDIREHLFLDSAYLVSGGCSLSVLSSQKSEDGNPYMIRMYDLGPDLSDFRMCSTNKNNYYTHSGFSVMYFGRSDGMNQHGLCVSFASCGFPVGNAPGMIRPKINGLNFMVIVRLLLETCKTTKEAVDILQQLPIASNMNLLITDAEEETVIVETIDGNIYIKNSIEAYTIATNHALVNEGQVIQKEYLVQSEIRFNLIKNLIDKKEKVSKENLLKLMSTPYPKGLSMQNYQEFFGTVYSVIFDINLKKLYFSFGSPAFNPVHELKIGEDYQKKLFEVCLPYKSYNQSFWETKRFK